MEDNDRPQGVTRFRTQYRAERIGGGYRGRLHFWFTTSVSLAVIGISVALLDGVTAAEWLVVPLTFVYANLVEYFGHRFVMHRPVRGLGLIYRRHACEHHRFFTDRAMEFDDTRDYQAVLFPPVLIVFYLCAFLLPTGALLFWLATPNIAWLVVATGTAYFLNYEWLHFAYHCSPDSRVGRLAPVRRLRGLHQAHHDPAVMTRYNFNITYPIGDWLFGTMKPAAHDALPRDGVIDR